METKAKRFVKSVAAGLILAQCLIFLPAASLAKPEKLHSHPGAPSGLSYSADVSQILSVLESRTEDRQLVERTKEKLFTLDHRQIRLIASLSDRVMKEGSTTGSEIAFLLMTALIALI